MTEPTPPEAYFNAPGLDLASTMNSDTDLAGTDTLIPMTTGAMPSMAMGLKSLIGSYPGSR